MARIPLLDVDDPTLSPEARAALEKTIQTNGRLYNIMRVMGHHPAAMNTFTEFVATVYIAGSLTPQHAELAYLTATVVNNCHY